MIGKLITGFKNLLPFLSAGLSGTLKMTAAIKLQTIALWEQTKAWLATPIGIISAITIGIFGIGKAIDALADDWQDEVEAAREALKVNEENIAKYESEIDSLEQLQDKLKEARGNKEALAAIQGELNEAIGETPGLLSGEASAYEAANKKIQDQIKLQKELLKAEQESAVANNTAIFNNNGIKNTLFGIDSFAADNTGNSLRGIAKLIAEMERHVQTGELSEETFEKQKNAMIKLLVGNTDWEEFWNDQVSVAYGVFQSTITSYDGFGGSSFVQKILDDAVRSGYTLDEISTVLDKVINSDLTSLVDKYYKSLSDPKADSESIYNKLLDQFNKLKNEYPALANVFDLYSKSISDNLNDIKYGAESVKASFNSLASELSKSLDKLNDKKDILSEVKEELDSFGAISADNISKILEQFSDNDDVQKAVAYYLSGIGTAQQLYNAMAKGYQNDLKLQAQTLATKMQNDEKYYESIGATNKSFVDYMKTNYGVDLSNATSLAGAKLKIENDLISTLKTNWQKYYNAQGASIEELVARARALMLNTSRGRETYAGEHAEATKRYNEIYAVYKQYKDASAALDQLTLKGFSSTGFNTTLSTDFDKDSGKTEAEKYFDKQKYLLETNQITQEEYLKRINQKYKEFYKNQGDDLEDYAKYSQEVYDGFKDMYKEDLEAQKKAWEEKKDAVSEYYDNLREQIEDAHDKEDYEKEQSEKRKEIFDLDMQIAELMRDGSEKAKARIAELEEERLKAEEELLDFETDKAREDELSRLEKEQEAEEKKIQGQIDGIQGQLDQLDKDTVSVRNAIIAYAKEKGVTLNFAYASGTRSSVGGFGRINEKGIEMISAPDGNGNYIPMLPNSYVFSAKATEFLWKLATEHSLPQAMYNSIAKSIKTQSGTPSVNIAQPITITVGDVIIKGNADKQTVADIKKQQENTVRMVLQKIKELQK